MQNVITDTADNHSGTYLFRLSFPCSLGYVLSVRRLIADILLMQNYDPKSILVAEMVADEACTHAIVNGSKAPDAAIELDCYLYEKRVKMELRHQGNGEDVCRKAKSLMKLTQENLRNRLRQSLQGNMHHPSLEVLLLLSDSLELSMEGEKQSVVRMVCTTGR